jgi:hypothetical protein
MDFDHPTFRFIELANQRNVLTGIWSSPTWGPDPELIDMVGDLDLEDYEKAKIGEIQLPPIVGAKKKDEGSARFAGGSIVGAVDCLLNVSGKASAFPRAIRTKDPVVR